MDTKIINKKYLAQSLVQGIVQWVSPSPLVFRCKCVIYMHMYNYIENVELYIQSMHRFNYKCVANVKCSINIIQTVLLET